MLMKNKNNNNRDACRIKFHFVHVVRTVNTVSKGLKKLNFYKKLNSMLRHWIEVLMMDKSGWILTQKVCNLWAVNSDVITNFHFQIIEISTNLSVSRRRQVWNIVWTIAVIWTTWGENSKLNVHCLTFKLTLKKRVFV